VKHDTIESIIAAAKAGDDNARTRATILGRALGGDQRAALIRDVEFHLQQARGSK
jgi:hypothetical protein